jgi:hypothetical protein
MPVSHDPDISLVAALWRFIEDGGTAAEFNELRERVRRHGALHDAAPALLEALEDCLRHVPGAREPTFIGRAWLENAVTVAASVRGRP